jgi:hypothetical protein
MRAITVKQPWAWAIAVGAKTVENRSRPAPWRSAVGERIAIHAGKGWDRAALSKGSPMWELAHATEAWRVTRDVAAAVPLASLVTYLVPTFHWRGAVMATAVLADVHEATPVEQTCCCRPWGIYAYEDGDTNPLAWHLVLRDIQPMKPILCPGALGLWTVPADVEAAMEAQAATTTLRNDGHSVSRLQPAGNGDPAAVDGGAA